MAHLRLVGGHSDPAPEGSGAWVEDTLDLPGLPPPKPPADIDESCFVSEPDPNLMTLLEAVDDLFAGRTPQEKALIGKGFYFDADGAPRTRHGQLKAV